MGDPADGRERVSKVDAVDIDESDAGPAGGLVCPEGAAEAAADDGANDEEQIAEGGGFGRPCRYQ